MVRAARLPAVCCLFWCGKWVSVLQCAAVCCSVMQCDAVYCRVVLAHVVRVVRFAGCVCVANFAADSGLVCCGVLQCVAVCCSVLPYVAVCCSVSTHLIMNERDGTTFECASDRNSQKSTL